MSKAQCTRMSMGLKLMLGVSTLALSSGVGVAQESAEPEEVAEVVVTATRRATNIQQVPYNITAIGAADVKRLGITELSDVARLTPGLSFRDAGARDDGSVILRGLSVSPLRTSTGGDNGSVAQYINETPVDNQPRVFDIDHIEVLRGPQGTLYGSGSLGGAIRYIVNDPKMYFEASAGGKVYKISDANDASYEFQGMVNLPLIEDKLALRVAAQVVADSGFTDYPFLISGPAEDLDFEDRTTVRASLLFTPTDKLSLTASIYHDNAKSGGRTGSNAGFTSRPPYDGESDMESPNDYGYPGSSYYPYTLGDYEIGMRFEEPESNHYTLSALEAKYDFGFAELTSSTSYLTEKVLGHRDQTDLLLGLGFGYESYPDFRAFTTEEEEYEKIVQEMRLVSKGDGPLSYVVGVYYTEEDLVGSSKEFTPGLPQFWGVTRPDDLEYYALGSSQFQEIALFGELTYQITDKWQITGGLRTFQMKDDVLECTALPLYDDPNSLDINFSCPSGKSDIKETIYKANTSYQWTPDVMVYGTFSQGFRRGGVNTLPEGGQFEGALEADRFYIPDSVDNFEIGLRSMWFDKTVRLNAALFHIDWSDIQLASLSAGGLPITTNAGKATSDGVEADLRWLASEDLTFTFAYAYTKAEISETYIKLDEDGNVIAEFLAGTPLPGSAESQFSAGVDYTLPFTAFGPATLHVDAAYSSDVTTSAELMRGGQRDLNNPEIVLAEGEPNPDYFTLDGFTEFNASLMFEPTDDVSVRLFVTNLTNELAFVSSQGKATYGEQGSFFIPIRPRTVGLEISKKF